MSTLERLKSAEDLSDLAKLLGFTPKGLSFVLYKIPPEEKYRTFTIPKKSGGERVISAPSAQLALLQRRLAAHLYECVAEIQRTSPRYLKASHGFQKKKSIVTNAQSHIRRRYVFNVDILDFFGSINFGRVRGYFVRDRNFELEQAIATIIAQIACHKNALPQGSPCSPVISNLIGNILDSRLLALARDSRCTYSRYADDLTFSTNKKSFPEEIAHNENGERWSAGNSLVYEIERTGFKLNLEKTNMAFRQSRQTVTGLVVNRKPNINQNYYRTVKAMCHSLFQTGEYQRVVAGEMKTTSNTASLEGMLSHIYFLKARRDRPTKTNRLAKKAGEFSLPSAPIELYKRFLFYKHFIAPSQPLIVTEGVSDVVYLECALRSLATYFPNIVKKENGKYIKLVRFLKPNGTSREILNLGPGASGQATLVRDYKNNLKRYTHKPLSNPVILLCDNDDGPKTVFSEAKKQAQLVISDKSTETFYYLGENLYLVKVPEGTPPSKKEIEELFLPDLLKSKVDGKSLNLKKEHGDESTYGKVLFAEKVVKPNAASIDFSGFLELLSRIDQSIKHYQKHTAGMALPTAPKKMVTKK